jgi:spore maturation protein CgeB
MRFLLLDTDYPAFLDWLYANNPALDKKPFDEQQRVHTEACFGIAGFCASNLRLLGHDAQDLHVNNEIMQKQWALEHGLKVSSDWRWEFRLRRGIVPWASRIRLRRWFYEILAAQIRDYKPDILLNQAVTSLSGRFIKEIKPYVRFVIGQHAATTLSDNEDYGGYDLMISSFPPTVAWCHSRGIRALQSRLGFEPRVLSYLKPSGKDFDLTFTGSMLAVHRSRQVWIEGLCRHFPQLKVWAPIREQIPPTSVLQNHYAGSAWGRDMFHVLCSSKIVLNHHGDVAPYANNMRLFEATGVGTCLLTDWKPNLGELFDVGKELLAYRSLDECVELIRYYLTHDEEREAIARAGQARTFHEHTYFHRMQELVDIVGRHLREPVALTQRIIV